MKGLDVLRACRFMTQFWRGFSDGWTNGAEDLDEDAEDQEGLMRT